MEREVEAQEGGSKNKTKKTWPQASGTGEKGVQIHVKSPSFPHSAFPWWRGPTIPVAHLDWLRLLLLKLLP